MTRNSFPDPGKRSKYNARVHLPREDVLNFYNLWTEKAQQKVTSIVRAVIEAKAKELGWSEVEFSDGACYLKMNFPSRSTHQTYTNA